MRHAGAVGKGARPGIGVTLVPGIGGNKCHAAIFQDVHDLRGQRRDFFCQCQAIEA